MSTDSTGGGCLCYQSVIALVSYVPQYTRCYDRGLSQCDGKHRLPTWQNLESPGPQTSGHPVGVCRGRGVILIVLSEVGDLPPWRRGLRSSICSYELGRKMSQINILKHIVRLYHYKCIVRLHRCKRIARLHHCKHRQTKKMWKSNVFLKKKKKPTTQ